MKLKHSLTLKLAVSAVSIFFLIGCAETTSDDPWIPLFDGESLDGWSKKGGMPTTELRIRP